MNATRTARSERMSRMGLLNEPAGYVEGSNLYEYVSGNPTGLLDPMGLQSTAPATWPATQPTTQPTKTDDEIRQEKLDRLVKEATEWNKTSPPWREKYECAEQANALYEHLQRKGVFEELGLPGVAVIERGTGNNKFSVYHNVMTVRIKRKDFVIDCFKNIDKDGVNRNKNFPPLNGQVIVKTLEEFEKEFPVRPTPAKD